MEQLFLEAQDMELARYWMWARTKLSRSLIVGSSLGESWWEEKAFAEDLGGCTWPPRSYSCTFCRRDFRSAQALGGHMNVHRRDRARLKQSPGVGEQVNIQGQQLTQPPQIGTTQFAFWGDASANPNPNSGIQASPPRSTGEEELLLPSTRRSLEEVVPLRPFIVPQVKIREETWEPKKEFGLRRRRDCDDVMINRNKRRRSDDFFIADQQVLEAEVLHRFNPVEKLDLELRLGRL